MLGDGRDVKLIDGRFLLRRLLAPVGRRAAQIGGFGMTFGNFRGGVLNSKAFGELAFVLGNRAEALDALGVDDGQIEPRLGAVVQENGIDHFARARPAVRTTRSKFPARCARTESSA